MSYYASAEEIYKYLGASFVPPMTPKSARSSKPPISTCRSTTLIPTLR